MKRWILFGILLTPCIVAAQTTSENIYNALETGAITEDQAMQYLARLLENRRESVPERLRSDLPDKCGFPILATLRNASAYSLLKKTQRFQSMQNTYVHTFSTSRGDRSFQFHFETSGPDAIPGTDGNGNTIPDWIEEAAIAAERSYRLEVDTLGYREPLNFGIYGFYNFFFLDMDAYGVTYFDSVVTQNPDTYTSSIEIENDFVGFFTTGYDALRVTIAHEFHHAIQLSYVDRSGSDLWYYELTSTWMEDVVYDEVNDYYQYLSASFGSPQRSLDICSGIRCGYHISQFFHMIEKKYNRSVIRSSWEEFITQNALSALDKSLDELTPSNLQTEFVDFSIWNFFTGSRSSPAYYPEGQFYPQVHTEIKKSAGDTSVTGLLDHLATHYYTFGLSDSVNAELVFNSLSASHFNLVTIEYKAVTGTYFVLNRGNTNRSTISGLLPGDSLTVVVANRNLTGLSTEYAFDLFFTKPSASGSDAITDIRFFPSPLHLKNSTSNLYLRFRLAQMTDVSLEIFSIAGKAVYRRAFSDVAAGPHDGRFESEFSWNGKDMDGKRVSSGVYLYRLKGNGFEKMGKIAVVR